MRSFLLSILLLFNCAAFSQDGKNDVTIITTKSDFFKPKTLDTVKIHQGTVCILRRYKTSSFRILKNDSVKTATPVRPQLITLSTMKIYSNPVKKGSPFTMEYKANETGIYTVQIMDAAGKIISRQQLIINAKQYMQQIQTGGQWSSGVYYLSLVDKNNKLISTSNFLLQ